MLQLACLLMAWFTALSRVSDYKHHWSDVLAGTTLGTIVALVVVSIIPLTVLLFDHKLRTVRNMKYAMYCVGIFPIPIDVINPRAVSLKIPTYLIRWSLLRHKSNLSNATVVRSFLYALKFSRNSMNSFHKCITSGTNVTKYWFFVSQQSRNYYIIILF